MNSFLVKRLRFTLHQTLYTLFWSFMVTSNQRILRVSDIIRQKFIAKAIASLESSFWQGRVSSIELLACLHHLPSPDWEATFFHPRSPRWILRLWLRVENHRRWSAVDPWCHRSIVFSWSSPTRPWAWLRSSLSKALWSGIKERLKLLNVFFDTRNFLFPKFLKLPFYIHNQFSLFNYMEKLYKQFYIFIV